MVQQKNDGSFGDIMPAEELLEAAKEPDFLEQTRALLFGTEGELQQRIDERRASSTDDLLLRIEGIERKLNKIIIHLGVKDDEILVVDGLGR